MANGRDAALVEIRRLFEVGTTSGLTDAELIARFNDREAATSEHSFAALVERHAPMVYRVCRSTLRDPNDADDAFQATFLVLARKASTLGTHETIGPWLHLVARRASSTLRSEAARRRAREEAASALSRPEPSQSDGLEVAQAVHEEIDRLPGTYRSAVVLCLLEGLTQEQAAQRLGWAAGTVRSRLARGRERLRWRLTRRGLGPASAMLGASIPPAPPDSSLIVATTRLSGISRYGGPISGTLPESVVLTVSHVLRSFVMTRAKFIAAIVLASFVGVAGVRTFAFQDPPAPIAEAELKAKLEEYKRLLARQTKDAPTPKTFMTRVHVDSSVMTRELNDATAQGWEFVQAVPISLSSPTGGIAQFVLIFRRAPDPGL
jgi:RNA polymerase sigma factor (sigma-70 family)